MLCENLPKLLNSVRKTEAETLSNDFSWKTSCHVLPSTRVRAGSSETVSPLYIIPCNTRDFPKEIQSFANRANLEEVLDLEILLGLELFSLASLAITSVLVELHNSETNQRIFQKKTKVLP